MRDIIQKTREDYNRIAKYFSNTRYDIWSELEQFKKMLKDGQNVLDWGCGNGRLIFLMGNKKVNYFGLDQSEELLKIAKTKFSKEVGEGWVKFYSTAKRTKKFPDDFFDLIFMIASFHHLPDEKSRLDLLKKSYKELKNGGRLIITVWNLQSDYAKQKMKADWKKISDNEYLIPWKNPQGEIECERYYYHFSKQELGELLSKAGFKIEKLGYYEKNNWTDSKGGRNLIAIVKK